MQNKKKMVGIDIGGSHISAGIVSNGKVLKQIRVDTSKVKTRKQFFSELFRVIDVFFDKSVKSIGVGFPSPVIKGAVYEVNNMPFMNRANIKNEIRKKYRVKCKVDNDANAFALAEARFGSGKGKKSVVGVTLGTGLGCGIVLNGKVYSGNTGAAGEISIIPADHHTLEYFASAKYIKKIGKRSKARAWRQFGANLGAAIAVVVNVLDPEIIILGGEISKSLPLFKKPMMAELKKHCYRHTFSKLRIVRSKLKDAAILGAICF